MFTAFVGGAEADSPCFLRQIGQTYGMQAEVLLNRRIRFLGLNALISVEAFSEACDELNNRVSACQIILLAHLVVVQNQIASCLFNYLPLVRR